jgi:hypothetical protein
MHAGVAQAHHSTGGENHCIFLLITNIPIMYSRLNNVLICFIKNNVLICYYCVDPRNCLNNSVLLINSKNVSLCTSNYQETILILAFQLRNLKMMVKTKLYSNSYPLNNFELELFFFFFFRASFELGLEQCCTCTFACMSDGFKRKVCVYI